MWQFVLVFLFAMLFVSAQASQQSPVITPGQALFVDYVWAGTTVAFDIVTRGDMQYVAYYDSQRRVTLACRALGSTHWKYKRLDEQIGWDSHNSLRMAFDSDGHIHLAGNMHAVPLKYWRTTRPGDISSMERIDRMVGQNELKCTYPRFDVIPDGRLTFTYRDGGSGNGNQIVNVYDVRSRTWSRYLDKPLFDGQGEMNAYYHGPVRDSKGRSHFAWVWRDTPDCSTNHDVSYARANSDMDRFFDSKGVPIELPITIQTGEIVDPIPVQSGLLNSVSVSVDSKDRAMITYHKFDDKGLTQLYTARLEEHGWHIYRTTNWKDRWEFAGGGSIPTLIRANSPRVWGKGKLYQVFTNKFLAPYAQIRLLDEETLRQSGEPRRLYSAELEGASSALTDDFRVNIQGGSIEEIFRGGRSWALCWESLGPNRDAPRESVPPASKLRVVELLLAED